MSELSLVKLRIKEGVWEGIISSPTPDGATPDVVVTYLETPLVDVEVVAQADSQSEWLLRVVIPSALISDGVHTFIISDKRNGQQMGSFSIVAGEPLSQDIRAEMDLLREELDMLKRAFRRHCLETMG